MRLVPIKEAAALYGVSVATIKRWKQEGKLEYVQPYGPGGAVRIKWEEKQ